MDENLKDSINQLKAEIDSLRPLDKDTENRIQQKFRLDWNYHSNNIEGNSLTFGETRTFLLHGITAEGKPLKDHLDIKGHNEALLWLDDLLKNNVPLTEKFIRELHELILHEPYDTPAISTDGQPTIKHVHVGQYKRQPNHVKTVTGEIFYFATPEETPAKMNDLMDWYKNSIEKKSLHPLELAALFHYKFIHIHPFDDGNGRLARILMNFTLIKFGFPPVIIKTQKKDEYYRALQQADGGDENYFVNYIAKLEIDSLELYLRGAKGENVEEEDDIDKEIALFKAQLDDLKVEQTFSLSNMKESLLWIERTILNDLNLIVKNLSELFEKSKISIQGNGEYIFFEYDKNILVEENRVPGHQTKTSFYNNGINDNTFSYDIVISLTGFDKPGYTRFNAQSITRINFEKYRFILTISSNEGSEKISFLYDDIKKDASSKNKEIVKSIVSDLMTKIKFNTEKTY